MAQSGHPGGQFFHNNFYTTLTGWNPFVAKHCYVQLFCSPISCPLLTFLAVTFQAPTAFYWARKRPQSPIFKFFRLKHDEQRVDFRPSAAALLPSLSRPKTPYLRAFCSLFRVRKYEQYQRTSRFSLTCSYYAAFMYLACFIHFPQTPSRPPRIGGCEMEST